MRRWKPLTGNRNLLFFCRQGRIARLKSGPSGSQLDGERQNFYTSFTSLSHMSECPRYEVERSRSSSTSSTESVTSVEYSESPGAPSAMA